MHTPNFCKSIVSCSRFYCYLLIVSLPAHGQHSELSFRNYTTQDGLAGNSISVMLQDSRRFLWIGTGDGLSRFDGMYFKNFYHDSQRKNSIPSNMVNSIVEYKKGHLLISCVSGSRCYNMLTDSFYLPNDIQIQTTLFTSIVSDMRGNWWLSDGREMLLLDSNLQIKRKLTPDGKQFKVIHKVHLLWNSRLLLHTDNGFFSGGNTTNEWVPFQKDFQEATPAAETRFSIYDPKTNRLIYLEWERGFYLINLERHLREFFSPGNCDGCLQGHPQTAHFDKAGNIWIGTESGVSIYNKILGRFQPIVHDDRIASSLIDNYVTAFFEDDENNIWIGTRHGLSKLNRRIRQMEIYRQVWEWKGKRQDIYDISKDPGGNLYIAAFDNGFFQYNPENGKRKHFEAPPGWTANCVGDTVYMTGHSISFFLKYNRKTERLMQSYVLAPFFSERSNLICFAHRDSYGDWWWSINEGGGLIRLPKNASHPLHYPGRQDPPGFPFSYAMQVAEDENGNIWFSNNKRHSIVCWLRNENRFVAVEPHKLVQVGPIPTTGVQALLTDKKGNAWLGTQGSGLIRYEINAAHAICYTIEDGLPSNDIKTLALDKAGRLWAGTSKGISCFLNNENRFVNFSKADGLPEHYFNEGSGYYDTTGNRVYMATFDFLLSFCPDSLLKVSAIRIPVYVEAIWASGKKRIANSNELHLQHNENDVRFEFTGVDLEYATSPVFAYKLEGADKDWHTTQNERSVAYQNLSHGKYSFRLRIQKIGTTEWNEMTVPLKIVILPAWWQTNWFYIMIAVLALSAAYFFIREVIYRKLEKQRLALGKQSAIDTERLRISSELHDDLGGGLSTIRLMSELIQHGDTNGESKKQLEKISSNSKELVQKMNEIVWAMNIKNDNLAGLLAYIRQYAVLFLDDNMLDCKLTIPEQVPDLAITGSRRRDIFLLVKESLNNVVKHARASKVDIAFTIDDRLQIKIHDDGVGFDATQLTTTSNGFRNMRRRVDELTGTMTIKNHQGTTLIFDMPLKNLSHESV